MQPQPPSTMLSYTIYRLGTWYTLYRFIIAFSLLLIFYITGGLVGSDYPQPDTYFYTLIAYTLITFIQGALFGFYPKWITQQLSSLFIIDIIALSFLTYAVGGPNLHLGLLYVVTVFSAAILLHARMSLAMTLFAVIILVYQQIVIVLFNTDHLNAIGDSILLAFLFFVVYGIGQIAVRRFQILETMTNYQSDILNQLQNINRYILDQVDDGYLVLDENYYIVVSNPAACNFLGIPPLFAHEQLTLAKVQPDLFGILKSANLQDGEKFNFESRRSTYQIHIHIQRLQIPKQSLILLTLQDTQKLNQHVQQLKLAALGQLSASIAHEIRNPLAAIAQANELFLESDGIQQKQLQHMITKQTKRINSIIEDTLGIARNHGTYPVVIQLTAFLYSLFDEDLADVKHQIHLVFSREDLQITFDPSQLRQILINLIRNALRHNAPDAPFVKISIEENGKLVWIDIIDYGDGVTKRNISQLFKPFFSTEIKGTGLGLYLSHSLCEANHAKLTYVEQEKGACFRIQCSSKENE